MRAINLAPQDARAWDARAEALLQQQRWDAALEASATSVRLDPSNPTLMHDRAFVLMWVGRPAEALPFSVRAIEIASDDDVIAEYRRLLCRAHLVLGRYGEAITECERAASHANFWSIHEFLTAAYALKGDMERARAAKERLLRARPGFTISWIEGYVALQPPTWQEQFRTHVIAGLRKAGVPER